MEAMPSTLRVLAGALLSLAGRPVLHASLQCMLPAGAPTMATCSDLLLLSLIMVTTIPSILSCYDSKDACPGVQFTSIKFPAFCKCGAVMCCLLFPACQCHL